jgi:hypothetical protein
MTTVVAEQLARERAEAQTSLSEPVVAARDFNRVAVGFGFASAVLIDSHGTVLRNYPASPSIVGQLLTGRYGHLRTALQGRPVVTGVVPNAAQGTPVAAFAVPFETTAGGSSPGPFPSAPARSRRTSRPRCRSPAPGRSSSTRAAASWRRPTPSTSVDPLWAYRMLRWPPP